MAIIAHCSSENYAAGNYHRIINVEIICAPGEVNPRFVVHLAHYFSEQARNLNSSPMYVNRIVLPFSEFKVDPRKELYSLIMKNKMFDGLGAVTDEKA